MSGDQKTITAVHDYKDRSLKFGVDFTKLIKIAIEIKILHVTGQYCVDKFLKFNGLPLKILFKNYYKTKNIYIN